MDDPRTGGTEGDDSATVHINAAVTPRTVRKYRITLETPDGIETRHLEALLYNEGFGQGPLVTFWGEGGPVASFSAKLVREIRLVEGDDEGGRQE